MKRLLLIVVIVAAALSMGARPRPQALVLQATEDAYVVTDASLTEDPQNLRVQNFGNLDFIKVWYASKIQRDEQVVTVGLVKFDLAPLKGLDVDSATLQLFALRADLAQSARLVDVSLISGPWTEKEVSYTSRPPWDANPIATTAVYGAGGWYSWDVTSSVVGQKPAGAVSFATGLRTIQEKSEEQVIFAAHEAVRNGPRLVITYEVPETVLAWWVWAGIVGAAALAFLIGVRLAKRLPGATADRKVAADENNPNRSLIARVLGW